MLKLKEFCSVRGISIYELAKRLEGEVKYKTLLKRGYSGWDVWHDDGTLYMKNNKGGLYAYEVELDA